MQLFSYKISSSALGESSFLEPSLNLIDGPHRMFLPSRVVSVPESWPADSTFPPRAAGRPRKPALTKRFDSQISARRHRNPPEIRKMEVGMNLGVSRHWCAVMATLLLVVSCSWPAFGVSTTVTGQARAMQMTINGITTMLSDTGTLAGVNDSRDGSSLWVGIPSLVSGENLSASTISWSDQVDSEASLARFNLTAGGAAISADFVMARASSGLGGTGSGDSLFTNLSINEGSVPLIGVPKQTIS